MVIIVNTLVISMPYYLVGDAYYCGQILITGLLQSGNHLISRVRSNAVAYFPPMVPSDLEQNLIWASLNSY